MCLAKVKKVRLNSCEVFLARHTTRTEKMAIFFRGIGFENLS